MAAVDAKDTPLVRLLIGPSLFPRLAHVAKTFQRIDYLMLKFEIVSRFATITPGGYVACVFTDPDDAPPNDPSTLERITSTAGSVQANWWQTSTITAPPKYGLYTSRSPTSDLRFSSPGVFALMTEIPPAQGGGFTIMCHWKARLYHPTLEIDVPSPFTSLIATNHIKAEKGQPRYAAESSEDNRFSPEVFLDGLPSELADGDYDFVPETLGVFGYRAGTGDELAAPIARVRLHWRGRANPNSNLAPWSPFSGNYDNPSTSDNSTISNIVSWPRGTRFTLLQSS